jgi:hypothetical protein
MEDFMRAFYSSVIAATLLAAIPAFAHHSLEAQFNPEHVVTLKGTITKVDWSNPHVRVYLDVPDPARKISWELEMGSPNSQIQNGWKINTLKAGDHVVVSAYTARDGSRVGYARSISKTGP